MSKLTHEEVEVWLFGEQDKQMATAVADHLAQCPQCQETALLVAQLNEADWHPYPKSPTAKAVIIADLQQQVRQKQMIKKQNKILIPMNAVAWGGAFVILILLTFGYFNLNNGRKDTNPIAAVSETSPIDTVLVNTMTPFPATVTPPATNSTTVIETENIILTGIGRFELFDFQFVDEAYSKVAQPGNNILLITLRKPGQDTPIAYDETILRHFSSLPDDVSGYISLNDTADQRYFCRMAGWLAEELMLGCEVPITSTPYTFYWGANEIMQISPPSLSQEVAPSPTVVPMPFNPFGNLMTEPLVTADIDCDNTVETVSITRPVLGDGQEVLAPYQLQVEDPGSGKTMRTTVGYWLGVTEPPYPRYYDVQALEIDNCSMAFVFTNQPVLAGNEWGTVMIWDGSDLFTWQADTYILDIEKGENGATMTTWHTDPQRNAPNGDACFVIETTYLVGADFGVQFVSSEEGMGSCSPNG